LGSGDEVARYQQIEIEIQSNQDKRSKTMNMKSIRRIMTLSMLILGALASMAVQAIPQPVFLVSPNDGETVVFNDEFTWTNTAADKYVLKFTILETGQKLKHTVMGASCGINECGVTLHETPLFNAVKDNQLVKWRVVARYGAEKMKSIVRTVTVDMVVAPTIAPESGAVMGHDDVLGWTLSPVNQSFTLVIRRVSTGETVIKETYLAGDCIWFCQINPHTLAELQPGVQYKWFVKATGFNGTKVKSAKHTFTVPFAEITN
jgi:hypothetical protein